MMAAAGLKRAVRTSTSSSCTAAPVGASEEKRAIIWAISPSWASRQAEPFFFNVILRQKLSTMFRNFNLRFLRDGTDTFQVRFLSDNPELSVRIVNMIARNYVRLEGRRLAARNIVPDIGVSLSATEARLVRPYLWVPFLTAALCLLTMYYLTMASFSLIQAFRSWRRQASS